MNVFSFFNIVCCLIVSFSILSYTMATSILFPTFPKKATPFCRNFDVSNWSFRSFSGRCWFFLRFTRYSCSDVVYYVSHVYDTCSVIQVFRYAVVWMHLYLVKTIKGRMSEILRMGSSIVFSFVFR